jgi:hypothetical protein
MRKPVRNPDKPGQIVEANAFVCFVVIGLNAQRLVGHGLESP